MDNCRELKCKNEISNKDWDMTFFSEGISMHKKIKGRERYFNEKTILSYLYDWWGNTYRLHRPFESRAWPCPEFKLRILSQALNGVWALKAWLFYMKIQKIPCCIFLKVTVIQLSLPSTLIVILSILTECFTWLRWMIFVPLISIRQC